jgi:hypothetical protein
MANHLVTQSVEILGQAINDPLMDGLGNFLTDEGGGTVTPPGEPEVFQIDAPPLILAMRMMLFKH